MTETWLQAHQGIILGILFLAGFLWLGNKYLDNAAAKAQTEYAIAQLESKKAASQADLAAKDYQGVIAALTKQNNLLAANVAQRAAVLTKKQEEIKTLPLPEVAKTWQNIIGGDKDFLSSIDGLSITDAGSRRTVSMLESVAVLSADVNDQKVIIGNQQTELDKSSNLISSLNNLVTANDTTCKAQVAAVKAVSNKSKRTWFILGFVAGIGTRVFGKF